MYDQDGNLTELVMSKNGIVKLNTIVTNGRLDATIFAQSFEFDTASDSSYIAIGNDGFINARAVKLDNDGWINITATIKTLSAKQTGENFNGDATINETTIKFKISVFTQITSINLDKQFINLLFSNNLWYEGNTQSTRNQANVNLSIYPTNAVADEITWQLSNKEIVNMILAENNRSVQLTALDGTGSASISLTVFVKQQNKIYSKTVYINIDSIIKPQNIVIDGVKVNGGNLTALTNTEYVSGVQAKTLYVDSRDLTNDYYIDILAHVPDISSTKIVTNKNVSYSVGSSFGRQLVAVDDNGRIKFNKDSSGAFLTGSVLITVFAEGSKTVRNMNATVCDYIYLTIADGLTERTAFSISTEDDFWKMMKDEHIENHYYVLRNS